PRESHGDAAARQRRVRARRPPARLARQLPARDGPRGRDGLPPRSIGGSAGGAVRRRRRPAPRRRYSRAGPLEFAAMSAYLIFDIHVTDPEGYEPYRQRAAG